VLIGVTTDRAAKIVSEMEADGLLYFDRERSIGWLVGAIELQLGSSRWWANEKWLTSTINYLESLPISTAIDQFLAAYGLAAKIPHRYPIDRVSPPLSRVPDRVSGSISFSLLLLLLLSPPECRSRRPKSAAPGCKWPRSARGCAMTAPGMNATTRTYLDRLFADAGTVELCHLERGRVRSTWHTRVDDLLAAARAKSPTGNLFTTLQRIDRDKLDAHLDSQRGSRTPDACIQRYSRLFFDLDPERPQGQSSTAAELAAAEVRARGLTGKLAALGWPQPLMAMSGNGAHLQYRCALPNTAETAAMLKTIYAGLAREFGDDEGGL
jgi:hypothetical protein